MAAVEHHIDVAVPPSDAYRQWTQFEDFPRFIDGVEEVRCVDDTHLRWRARFDGTEAAWECEVTEQRPDERIGWRSTTGMTSAGVITFHRLDEDCTRVMLLVELDGDPGGAVHERMKRALRRFKELVES